MILNRCLIVSVTDICPTRANNCMANNKQGLAVTGVTVEHSKKAILFPSKTIHILHQLCGLTHFQRFENSRLRARRSFDSTTRLEL